MAPERYISAGYLWFGNWDDKFVERIDPRTHQIVHPSVPIQNGFAGMAVGLGGVWVVDGKNPSSSGSIRPT